MSRIELVVFDLAGTTVRDDDAVGRCFREALAAAGVRASRGAVNAVMGLAKPEAVRRLLRAAGGADAPAPSPERVAAVHADFVARMIACYRAPGGAAEVAGARAVFRRLRADGVAVGLDTGFGRSIVDALLAGLGWRAGEDYDACIASDEVAHPRPHPDMIRALMARTGVSDPARVAKVGDAPADLAEGTSAGCALVVGVLSGTHRREELARHPHTHLIDSVADLPALLDRAA